MSILLFELFTVQFSSLQLPQLHQAVLIYFPSSEVVISLDAEDDFLKKRIMNLPESVVAGTHKTEDLFLKRLAEFRAINTDDQTVLNYFDELEVHPEHLDIAADTSSNMSQVLVNNHI